MSFLPLMLSLLLPGIVSSQLPGNKTTFHSNLPHGSMVTRTEAPLVTDSGAILFQVDLSQWAAKGRFNPATDSLDMPGTFNNWEGSASLQKVGSSLIYEISLGLDSLTVQQFRFRINRDSARMEFPSGENRLFRVPGHAMTVKYLYNDFDTTAVPMTFRCHMAYQINAYHFDPQPYRDYLDMAGSMNDWGAYDLLFDNPVDSLRDSIYHVTLNFPRSLISDGTPLAFKFRINGNWNTSEFPNGGPFRTFFLKDTAGGVQNLVDVWYNDQNPAILAPPRAYNLYIQGDYYAGRTLTGSYTYEDVNLRPEGASVYKWYRADSLTQVTPELRTADTTINYVLDSTDYHKYLAFEVTPVAQGTGDSLTGKPVRTWTGLIGGVGIGELNGRKPGIYPNPVTSLVTFTNMDNIRQIGIYSITGQNIAILDPRGSGNITYDASGLQKGIYFVKFSNRDHSYSTVKLIKD
jgi:hypothetical protein